VLGYWFKVSFSIRVRVRTQALVKSWDYD
jgi:hypothetical protein